jgi:hypothetical protein
MFELFGIVAKNILIGLVAAVISILPTKIATEPSSIPRPEIIKVENKASTTPEKRKPVATTTTPSSSRKPQSTTKQNNVAVATTTGTAPRTITIQILPLEPLNEKTRSAVVNILCTTKNGGDFKPLSGSGIFINENGVVLTNAHIGQYFLLRDYGIKNYITCVARQGSPATPAFFIEPLYVSKKWVEENARFIKQEDPTGTGENDFALLRVVGKTNGEPLPVSFPYIEPNIDPENVLRTLPVLITAYPAGFLGGTTIQTNLSLTSSIGVIKELFNFHDNTLLDIISIDGNILSQRGSSGGGVINRSSGKLEGIITTSTDTAKTGDRELFAITPGHIDRVLKAETGKTLAEFISQDLDIAQKNFTENLSKPLIDLLIKEVEK